jgi:hypothetical protein
VTNEEHNRYIAFAFIAHGAFQLLMGLFMAAMVYLITQFDDPSGPPPPPPAFFFIVFGFMFVFQMLFAAPSFIASYALLKRKPWARIASIIAAALSAMNVPVGTAAAVYSLWFFCGEQWKSVYPETAERDRVDPLRITPAPETKWEGYTKDEEGEYVYRTPPPPDWR